MRSLLIQLAIVYLLSVVALGLIGVPTPIPWAFLPFLAVMVIPFAYAISQSLFWSETLLRPSVARLPVVAVPLGITFVIISAALASLPGLAFALLLFFLAHLWVSGRKLVPSLATGVVALLLIYGSVWNMNYLLGALAYARRLDAIVLEWDLATYQFLLGDDTTLEGLFPLVKSWMLFRLTEGAYTMLFVQVFVVIFMLAELKRSARRYLVVTLVVYLAAGVVFFLWPVVGPFIYPETLHVDFRASVTGDFGRMMAADYERMESRQASNGFGYIVGLPSLHVAMAVIMQWFLAASRIHFWAFLPVNILLIVATFFLGFHYLVDVAGGILHATLVLGGFHAWDTWTTGSSPAQRNSRMTPRVENSATS